MDWSLKVGIALMVFLSIIALTPPPHNPTSQVDPVASRNLPPATRLIEIKRADGEVWLAREIEVGSKDVTLKSQGLVRTLQRSEVTNIGPEGIADSRLFLLGTDRFGRDVWSRLITGARISMIIGLLSVALAMTWGILLGTIAATGPSWLDSLIMRCVDGLLSFPTFFLILAISALIRPSIGQVILILGCTSWMTICRLARGEVLSLKQQEFVLASRSLGSPMWRIALKHMLPNALTPLIVQATLMVGDLILSEAALSYFGLGVQPPTASWGNMIADGQDALAYAWWNALFPGIAISITVIAFNLVGDGLRTHLDPMRHLNPMRPEQMPGSAAAPDLSSGTGPTSLSKISAP